MARIFFALSLFVVALLAINVLLGFRIGDLQTTARRVVAVRRELAEARQDLLAMPGKVEELEQDLQTATAAYTPIRDQVRVHVLFGIAASLVTLLVNSITITYFIGTSRWCKEVVDTYSLDEELADRSRRLKRGAWPWAVVGVISILAIVMMGAVSDPSSANFENSVRWVLPHRLAALAGVGIIAWSLLMQVGKIGANYEVIEQILDEVKEVRRTRGLDELSEDALSRFRL
ncbi:MAG: hypothetical protein VB878_01760 [Pirellulaceae bacterium]